MTVTKTYLGVFPPDHPFAGQPHYSYVSDGPLVYVGPYTSGTVEVSDGTVYDLTESVVEAPLEHHGEIDHQVGLRLENEGHPTHRGSRHPDYDPLEDEFHHVCGPSCGPGARSAEEHHEQFKARLHRLGHGHRIDDDGHARIRAKLEQAYQASAEAPTLKERHEAALAEAPPAEAPPAKAAPVDTSKRGHGPHGREG